VEIKNSLTDQVCEDTILAIDWSLVAPLGAEHGHDHVMHRYAKFQTLPNAVDLL